MCSTASTSSLRSLPVPVSLQLPGAYEGTREESAREYTAGQDVAEVPENDENAAEDDDRATPEAETVQSSSVDRGKLEQLLTETPKEVVNLLHARLFRMAVFYILSQEVLRTNAKLLSSVQERIYLDMRSLTSGRPHDLAIRLGWTLTGVQRGPAREALHQKMVVEQGRLPSIKEIERAVLDDNFDPHGRFSTTTTCDSALPRVASVTIHVKSTITERTQEEWTRYYNQQLHRDILEGASARQTRKDEQKALHHSRPTGELRQLSSLLHKIQKLKRDRGFRPDWVTVNLVVKTWLRGLAAGPQKSQIGVDDIFKAFKKALTMDAVRKQNLDFNRDIQPLVKMLVKALKNNGEWLKAREVLAWMAEIRNTMSANAESGDKPINTPETSHSN